MILLAGTVLVVAVVFGLLSRGHSLRRRPRSHGRRRADPLDQQIDAVVEAVGDVGLTVTADGWSRRSRWRRGDADVHREDRPRALRDRRRARSG
jgi:hypothetical protein